MQLFKEFSNKRRQQARLTRDSVQKHCTVQLKFLQLFRAKLYIKFHGKSFKYLSGKKWKFE